MDLKNLTGKREADKPAAASTPAPRASTETVAAKSDAKPAVTIDLAALGRSAIDVDDVGKSARNRSGGTTGPLPLEKETLATIETGKAKAIPVPTLDYAREVMNAVRRVGNRHDVGTKVRVFDTSVNPPALVQYRRDKDKKEYFWSATDGTPYTGKGPFQVRFQATKERAKRTNGEETPVADAPPAAQ